MLKIPYNFKNCMVVCLQKIFSNTIFSFIFCRQTTIQFLKLYGGGKYREFTGKSSPREKTAIKKKNSKVRNREFDSLFHTVEIFLIAVFFLGELLPANCY
jgi:hypothetical protein